MLQVEPSQDELDKVAHAVECLFDELREKQALEAEVG